MDIENIIESTNEWEKVDNFSYKTDTFNAFIKDKEIQLKNVQLIIDFDNSITVFFKCFDENMSMVLRDIEIDEFIRKHNIINEKAYDKLIDYVA